MATYGSTISIKLLIDPKRQKVLFAEAEKDFVDFLFTLLTLPLGTLISLISNHGMVGCLGRLHKSVESLGDKYMQPNLNKDILLNPISGGTVLHHLLTHDMMIEVSDEEFTPPDANEETSKCEGGYVKDVVTYMIMDDLEVKPLPTISSIAVLNKFKVKDVGSVEEKVVHLGMEEGLKLLQASLKSKSVLSHVFLGKQLA